jgi:hypothetical protein
MQFYSFPPTDPSQWEAAFYEKVLWRAKGIVADGAVRLLERSTSHLTARVQGSQPLPYLVLVRANGSYRCTCPSEVQPCKHVAATLLAAMASPAGAVAGSDTPTDLSEYLQQLDASAAKALLLELAEQPQVRQWLLTRRCKPVIPMIEVIETDDETDTTILRQWEALFHTEEDVEAIDRLAERAFEQLQALPPSERGPRALALRKLIEDFEIAPSDNDHDYDDDNYDGNDNDYEAADGYWQDRRDELLSDVMFVWAEAECELGRGAAAFATLMAEIDILDQLWYAALQTAVALQKAGNDQAKNQLTAWMQAKKQHSADQYQREFLAALAPAAEYEQYLREHCTESNHYLELFYFLSNQQRQPEGLDLAATIVRRFVLGEDQEKVRAVNNYHPLQPMIEALRQAQPSFEWEMAAFAATPSLAQYQALKTWPAFASARAQVLALPINRSLHTELLLDDGDLPVLRALLAANTWPEFAVSLIQVLPAECAVIFRAAALENLAKGDRKSYQIAANWAKRYRQTEQPAVFKQWLNELLIAKSNRPALLDEFRKAGLERSV